MLNSILVVGGGTAGWMTALYLSKKLNKKTKISLVESEDIGIIGVGEGSTPYLKHFFQELDIPEKEWMAACDATYKTGIQFDNWSTEPAFESYFHPFFNAFDKKPADMFFYNSGLRRRGFEADAHPEHYFTAAYMAKEKRSPVTPSKLEFDIDYAYHFDSVKLGQFMREKAKAQGVEHLIANIVSAKVASDSSIMSVQCDQGDVLTADFFVDCTGFASLLLQQTLKRPFDSYSQTLFNDAAVAIQTPHEAQQSAAPQTVSKALSAGWMWNIPLTTRWGNGYVYSSKYLDADAAEKELKRELDIPDDSDIKVKHLKMRVGRVSEHWYKNCVGIGLSQGFIEPLEATALMLVQFGIQNLTKVLNCEKVEVKQVVDYNNEMNRLFDGVKDYISVHYALNTRHDSEYWADCREKIKLTATVKDLIKSWDRGEDFEAELTKHHSELVYLRPSWYCILSGMGRFAHHLKHHPKAGPVHIAKEYCHRITNKHFPTLEV
ncbi:MAG: tryptophan 7-halogenase [Alteromonadaceae bacterium]|nr:tryptophan 7-halogenase [Alteromonadaceae bacterium]